MSEIDVVAEDSPLGNVFRCSETVLKSEKGAVCARAIRPRHDAGRSPMPRVKVNPISGKPTAYKLLPFTKGPAMPTLLTGNISVPCRRRVSLQLPTYG